MNFSWKYHRCITKVHRIRVYLSHITSINGKIKPKFTNSLFPKVVRTSKRYKVVNWMAFLCKSFCKHTLDIRVRLDKTFQDQNMRIYSQCLIQDPLFVSQNCIHDLILTSHLLKESIDKNGKGCCCQYGRDWVSDTEDSLFLIIRPSQISNPTLDVDQQWSENGKQFNSSSWLLQLVVKAKISFII